MLLYRRHRVPACTCADDQCPAHVGRIVVMRDYVRQVPQYFLGQPGKVLSVSGWNSGLPTALVEWTWERHDPIRGCVPVQRRHRIPIQALKVCRPASPAPS